ncbi:MAG: class E sortase [candidate division SR1 bacterium]|nr:class E sortase [candidate division SR1 bacterium]
MHLDDVLNHHGKKKLNFRDFIKEIRIFLIFFFIVAIVMMIVTNLNLFVASFGNLFDHSIAKVEDVQKSDVSQGNDISSLLDQKTDTPEVKALLAKYQSGIDNQNVTDAPESLLRAKLKNYPFNFNTLPPVNKIVITTLGLDVPIIEPKSMTAEDFITANFDEELNNGVVKYPTTPDPGASGNSLIFGHTSQEFWKHNVYGTIFKGIPKLVNGDTIKIIREGNLFEYKVVDKFVVVPSQVNAQYMSYQNAGGSYITLMGCYPLGTDKKRIMVVAKLVN